jgi:flagellar basal body rod protein FlgG
MDVRPISTEGAVMHRILLAPICLIAFACQSSQYVTRGELHDMLALPPSDHVPLQYADLDALVAGAFSAPEPTTRAAATLAVADTKMAPLTNALNAIDQAFGVCAKNLANAETTAYKRVEAISEPGGAPNFRANFEQGPLQNTGRELDLGIQGRGFFKVRIMDSADSVFAYTRNGNFFVNHEGFLVLGMGDGYKLAPAITVPAGATDVSISADGKVAVIRAGSTAPAQIGQIEIVQFANPSALELLGGSLYRQTDASGQPTTSKPTEYGAGQVVQGFLECSNVDPTKEHMRLLFLQHWRATIMQVINNAK